MIIRIFTTGGTFDKKYNPLKAELIFTGTAVPKLLERSWCKVKCVVTQLMAIDSLYMTAEHRLKIIDACRQAVENNIVITHGTDPMCETAAALGRRITGKTIVLTGALIPAGFGGSDALFNLGAAIAFVQVLQPGVYIAMNGKLFVWDNVCKDKQSGVFETLR